MTTAALDRAEQLTTSDATDITVDCAVSLLQTCKEDECLNQGQGRP